MEETLLEKPKAKRGRKPKAVTDSKRIDEIASKVDSLSDLVYTLVETTLAKQKTPEIVDKIVTPAQEPVHNEPESVDGLVPRLWRDKIHMVLGQGFTYKILESSGGNYVLDVYLPVGLDRRIGDRVGLDHSTGLIRRSSDLQDVEEWCVRIKNNIKSRFPDWEPKV